MTLDELLRKLNAPGNADLNKTIDLLKGGIKPLDVEPYKKQYDVKGHDVLDKSMGKRPDKIVYETDEEDKEVQTTQRVARIGLEMQKLICSRAEMFLVGTPPALTASPAPANEQQQLAFAAIGAILKGVKADSHNKELALDLFRSTQVAECWYVVEEKKPHSRYGFETKYKLRVTRFSPWLGDELYPLFDETGDMIAFSRAYTRKDAENKDVKYFVTYTAETITTFKQEAGSGWEEVTREENVIGKIPVVYAQQPQVEWAGVQNIIDQLEKTLSDHVDTNEYHGSPTIVSDTDIVSFAKKGEKGRVLVTPGNIQYLSWNQAPESIKLEIDTHFRMIYTISQTPDISMEALKSIGDISARAIKLLFMDAHLKVEDKKKIFDPFFERRLNIIKAYLAVFKKELATVLDQLSVELVIRPYMIDDQQALVDLLTTATNGQPILSQQSAVGRSGLTDDPAKELEQIKAEAEARNVANAVPNFQ